MIEVAVLAGGLGVLAGWVGALIFVDQAEAGKRNRESKNNEFIGIAIREAREEVQHHVRNMHSDCKCDSRPKR